MRAYGAALVAACSIVSSRATDILEGPEFIDVLLPEVGHVFGVTSAHHTTLEEMNLRVQDVYVLPPAPKLEDCLSALVGIPITHQVKPFSDSVSMLDVKPYQNAQLKIAEARAAELAASVAPLVALAPKSKFYKSASLSSLSIEIAPGPYQSMLYAIVQALVYAILVPGALRGIRSGRSTAHAQKMLLGTAFFVFHSAGIVILQNVLSLRALIAIPVSLALGLAAMMLALRSMDSVEQLHKVRAHLPHTHGMEREPLAWCACMKLYCILLANMSYHLLSSLMPYRYGLAGIITGNVMLAGLLYLGYLVVVASLVFRKIREDPDSRKVQCRIVSLNCAYIAASGVSFYTNLIAVYCGVGDFVALEPAVFFTANRIFELNLGTIIAIIALLAMWGMAYHEQSQMDESGKNVSSMSSVALSTHEESRRALEEALHEMRTGAYKE
ncbi:hypothetical protein, conserved [Eimeria maxima]|uniref:Uncharacterized protein n=1 Tax=Eimeria maxima TaxID=5804 RepID=U6M9K0_EIMMA|nr:hypothetical protein, conserved [Eimeria maxima]CDJ60897.1 hypothetical protein, conserved [Eimeria maxima]